MSEPERDPHTGRLTTGHDWNGIKELNSPVPKLVWFFLILTTVIAVVMWVLLPTWPTGRDYTKGILNTNQYKVLDASLEAGAKQRAPWTHTFETTGFDELQADPAAMLIVRENGRRMFEDNCAMCHGRDGQGGRGFPDLTDDQWLWGGSPEDIMETLRVGVNNKHDEARLSQMLAFGRDGILDTNQRRQVVSYVQSLSEHDDASHVAALKPADIEAGRDVFAMQCATCHGVDGKGLPTMGAPNLTDDFWLYGGRRSDIEETVYGGRQGVMPFWEDRLDEVDRKILTLYVLDMGERQK
ncbi:cytochrome-c oxidase, cbb3-type subunit III [Hyphomonas johnsonii]|uniref:Cbb3-type cytochrome c oxidase subunit n=1 Tax=Hyphomonas johnsonii MHS-2 TaxID=1280950 RepID=A0A059FSC7_9PROT|nr:cytochrome-c oxidase, cbb3-type subunit III [Hyphomonas johnsonii]KCZ93426.1 cbb3-type cytochrome oxidase, subunit CcoP [Hyphomonas johnsonii MHS-2]